MKTLYLECHSGISGDMTVAALLDLGGDEAALRGGLDSLGVEGYHIHIARANKRGVDACDFHVHLEDRGGQDHGGHSHSHGDEHSHVHRNLDDIRRIILGSAITDRARELALRIFQVVAEAEAKVHGLPPEEVHFHEVGAVDSIVDIVGAAILVDSLGVDRVCATPLCEGQGTVRCQHGEIPVPAPATLEIARAHGVPLHITPTRGELVTPTGAAIVAALAESYAPPEAMAVKAVGYGAGKRDYDAANVLRATLWEELPGGADSVVKLECNLDDMTGEELARACEILLEAGALDVWCTPITMKKSRPAQQLSALLPPTLEEEMTRLLFLHTTTIGVRRSTHLRHTMERRSAVLQTPYGAVEAKESRYGDICKIKVEYESARALAKARGIPLHEILRAAYSGGKRKELKD